MKKYKVLFSSRTGNTEKVAVKIFEAIEDSSKDIQKIEAFEGEDDAEVYFIGFWADRGSCSMDVMDCLDGIHGKKIALFGTCGMGSNKEYYDGIEASVSAFIPDDNEYLGIFLCQGKMPIQVRKKYEEMLERNPEDEKAKFMVRNFNEAMLHPNQEDLNKASAFARKIVAETANNRQWF